MLRGGLHSIRWKEETEVNTKVKKEVTSNRSKLDNEWERTDRVRDGLENTKLTKDALSSLQKDTITT